jgi:hypothetical protein
MQPLWRNLLIEGRPDLSAAALQACVQRSRGDLRAVSLSLMNTVQFTTNRACYDACMQLEFLKLPSGLGDEHFFRLGPHLQKLRCLKLGLKIGIDRIGLILYRLSCLEHAEFLDVKPYHSANTWVDAVLPNLRVLKIATSSEARWHPLFLVSILYYSVHVYLMY